MCYSCFKESDTEHIQEVQSTNYETKSPKNNIEYETFEYKGLSITILLTLTLYCNL